MPRWSLIFGKKRGERRTGSTVLGRAAIGLFAATFFTAGMISLAFVLLKLSIPEWRVNHQFVETICRVTETRVAVDSAGLKRPEIHVVFPLGEQLVTAWSHYDIAGVFQPDDSYNERIMSEFEPDHEYPCWYDPQQPETVVLVRGYSWFAWLMLLLPASFITLGGGGLILALWTWGKSTERLAATTQNAPGLDFFLPSQAAPPEPFPYVPDSHALNDSPGTFLAYRLTPGTAGWSTAAIAIVCALWNLAVIVFARMALQLFQRGEPDWWLTVFVVPLLAGGLFCVALLVRRLLIVANIGPTLVEISAHPLIPGGMYEIYLSQAGRLAVKKLKLKLVCEEVATYRQGTNTRKTTRRVFEQSLVECESFKIRQGLHYESRSRLHVPLEVMHSFKASHNHIDWKLVVNASVERWPDFERSFPVVVRPPKAVEEAS